LFAYVLKLISLIICRWVALKTEDRYMLVEDRYKKKNTVVTTH